MRVLSFQEHDSSGISTPQRTVLYIVTPKAPSERWQPLPKLGEEFANSLKECLPPAAEGYDFAPGTVAIPLLGLAIQEGVSFVVGHLASMAQELEADSQRTYAARVMFKRDSLEFDGTECLVFLRETAEPEPEVGLALVLKLERFSADSYVIEPRYLMARNAVAVTADKWPINLSVALVEKAARSKADGTHEIVLFGKETFTFGNVELNGKAHPSMPESTGLLPLPPDNTTAMELSLAVTETGSAIPDAAKAKAELKALEAAAGPALIEYMRTVAAPSR